MTDLIKGLNPGQYKAATSTDKRLQIIAGAGTGKTHTLIARIAFMVEHGVKPENILLITFTNKAADEMKERADRDTDGKCKNVTATTYHSFCANMLRRYAINHDAYKDFSIYSEPDSVQFMEIICQRNSDTLKPLKQRIPKHKKLGAKNLLSMLSMHVNTEQDIEKIIKKNGYDKNAVPYIKTALSMYIEGKKLNRVFDFDDLLTQFLHVLQTDPAFRKELCNQYRYILIDEHQDSNNVQNKIIQMLTTDRTFLTVVGDEFQSIYAFRGANVDNFMKFKDDYMNDNGTVPTTIALERNYRSTTEILELGNSITRNAEFGQPKNLFSDKHGKKSSLYTPHDVYEAAEIALSKILSYRQNTSPDEIAVLSRTSSEPMALETLLNRANIPYEKRGGLKFFEQECVMDILAFQKLCIDPSERIQWYRILKQLKDVGPKRAQDISDEASKKDFLINSSFAKQKTATDISVHRQLTRLNKKFNEIKAETNIEKQLDIIIEYVKNIYDKQLDLQIEKNNTTRIDDCQKKIERLEEAEPLLKDMIKRYKSLQQWLDDTVLKPTADIDNSEGGVLVLSTIHSAKGLEWDHVILINATEGGIPSSQTLGLYAKDKQEFEKQLAEDRRLFYVAVTRPRFTLDLIAPETIKGERQDISRFVEESYNYVDRYY